VRVDVGTVDVDDLDRYVIAKYFGSEKPRASRKEVRAFARAALRTALRNHADGLRGRARATATRLGVARVLEADDGGREQPLAEPRERQLNLLDGAKE